MLRATIRRIAKWTALGALLLATGFAAVLGWIYQAADTSTVGDHEFVNRLAIPPLLKPTVTADGTKSFDLHVQAGVSTFLQGKQTPTWGVNGPYLAPTVRVSRHDRVRMRVHNGVDEPTTMHWHGMDLPAAADGGPHQLVGAGATWEPSWTIDQPAATLWFHPHLHRATLDHVHRGVAGMLIVDDPAQDVDLPDDYGVDDIPIILQDRSFDGTGAFTKKEPPFGFIGPLGGTILVNGTHDPYLPVTTRLVRLRLLNASNGRVYNVGFADDRTFDLVATDSGLLERPVGRDRIQLSPGERAEIVVGVSPGERAVLRSHPPDLGLNFFTERTNGGDDTFELVELRAAASLAASPPVPDRLSEHDVPDRTEAAATREFVLTDLAINGKTMDHDRIDVSVPTGTTEIWSITNRSGTPHSFHPHLIRFKVLDIDGNPPPAELGGWKDTVYVPPGRTIRIIGRFQGIPDLDFPFMFHCHILQHEDAGMMGQFVLTDGGAAGTRPPAPRAKGHNHG